MIRHLSAVATLAVLAVPAAAQTRTADFNWNKALAAGATVSIHNINGDIKVVPSTSGRVEVLGFKRGSGRAVDNMKVDVVESGRGVNICVIRTDIDSYCDEEGMHQNDRRSRWSRDDDWGNGRINLEVAVPANLTVRPSSVSGNVDVNGANGDISASSVSGDVTLEHLRASSVRANSVSGNVTVRIDQLTGNGDFSFHSVSGDVVLEVPRDFGAELSMSTVSGDIDSDFPITLGNGRMNRRSLNARIGAGGRRLDVSTVSGDLKLRMNK
jgi:DUF4097 and DUF4098 domain-containing protein YvlB